MSRGAVDQAIVARLAGDTALASMMPDGVFFGRAFQGGQAFVVVDLQSHAMEYEFQDAAFESFLYLVKAVAIGTSNLAVEQASERIEALLHNQTPASLPISGYSLMRSALEEYVRAAEDDPENTSVRWQHTGGYYRFYVQATG